MNGFRLQAHNAVERRSISAEFDGISYTITRDDGQFHAPNIQQALRAARDYLGQFLTQAQDGPWGLAVFVAQVSAQYGEPFPGEAPGLPGNPLPSTELVVRIRSRWEDGDSPRSALENAIEIIKAYSELPRRRAA